MSTFYLKLKKDGWDELKSAFKLAIQEESFHISQIHLPISYAFNMNALSYFKLPSKGLIKKLSLVQNTLRRCAADYTAKHVLDPRSHYLYLSITQSLCGVESAALAPCYYERIGDLN